MTDLEEREVCATICEVLPQVWPVGPTECSFAMRETWRDAGWTLDQMKDKARAALSDVFCIFVAGRGHVFGKVPA